MWIARDYDETLWLHNDKPQFHRLGFLGGSYRSDTAVQIDRTAFTEVTFETGPREVEIKLKEQ